jgi:hypothetical protein
VDKADALFDRGADAVRVGIASGVFDCKSASTCFANGCVDCGGADFPFEVVAAAVESMLPTMRELKITIPEEVHPATLAQRMKEEVLRTKGIVLSPGLIGAWSRKAA